MFGLKALSEELRRTIAFHVELQFRDQIINRLGDRLDKLDRDLREIIGKLAPTTVKPLPNSEPVVDSKHPNDEMRIYAAARVMDAVEEAKKQWVATQAQGVADTSGWYRCSICGVYKGHSPDCSRNSWPESHGTSAPRKRRKSRGGKRCPRKRRKSRGGKR